MGTLAEATELKNKGNEAFKKQDWPEAVEWYTKAIETYDKEPSFYTNRAQVSICYHAPHATTFLKLNVRTGKYQA